MKKTILCKHDLKSLFALIVFVQASVFAQPVKQWDKALGIAPEGQSGYISSPSIRKTKDGNFITATTATNSAGENKTDSGQGFSDIWVIKFNPDGTKIWDKTIVDRDAVSDLTSIQPTSDGGYLICGSSSSSSGFNKSENSRGLNDFWIIKLNSNGVIEWDKTIGGDGEDIAKSIIQTADGGYLVAGWSGSGISGEKTFATRGENDYWTVKLSSTGTIEWDAAFGGAGDDYLFDIAQGPDQSYFLGGYSDSPASEDKSQVSTQLDAWVVKIDLSGVKIWEKTISKSDGAILNQIIPYADGGMIISGRSWTRGVSEDEESGSSSDWDGWIAKLDAQGNVEYDKTLGGYNYDAINYVEVQSGGDILVAANSESDTGKDKTENSKEDIDSDQQLDFWLIKLSSTFEKIWDKTIGGEGNDNLFYASEYAVGKYTLIGSSTSGLYYAPGDRTVDRKGQRDLWIVNAIEIPLPVTLASFSAQKENTTALLAWSTTSETHSDRFEVQHSLDGKAWNLIATVKSNGDVNKPANYMLVDNKPALGANNLYRLKMIDADDTFTYSKIESLHFDGDATLNIFPNPAFETLNINLADWHNVKTVELLNSRSNMVYHSGEKPVQSISIKDLSAGIYFVRIELVDGSSTVRKVLIRK